MTRRPRFEILTSATFWGFTDQWAEYLCIEREGNGGVTLTSRSRQVLAEVGQYIDEEGELKLPSKIEGKKVWGIEGDFVLGESLVLHDGTSTITVQPGDTQLAADWLAERKWDTEPDFEEVWTVICAALLPPPGERAAPPRKPRARRAPAATPQPNNRRPTEIILRCSGYPNPGVMWFELVFIEMEKDSYSIYTQAGIVDKPGAELPKLIAKIERPLTWREAAKFVRAHGSAKVDPGAQVQVEAQGVETWQKDAIVHAMHPHWETDQFLRFQPDRDLKLLHDTLDGLVSEQSRKILSRLQDAACHGPLLHKSLSQIAKIVGAAIPIDAETLLEDIWAYHVNTTASACWRNTM